MTADGPRIAVIDHGAGNLVSMERALERVGAVPERIAIATDLDGFDGVVLPGVGATGSAMRTLRRTGIDDALVAHGRPMLAVCVGMQLLFEWSDEDDTACLGIVSGRVRPLDAMPLPHMGWNDVVGYGAFPGGPDPSGEQRNGPFYFVHSYAPEPADGTVIVGRTRYGSDEFASVVRSGDTIGAQFHPERSGSAGLRFLEAFTRSCSEAAHAA